MNKKRIIILYDLIAREYWMANQMAENLRKHNFEVRLYQWNFEYYKALIYSKRCDISLLIIPSCYTDLDYEKVVMPIKSKSPDLKVICMNSEQIGYYDDEVTLVPKSDLCRYSLYHFAWGTYFSNLLEKHGVPQDNIIKIGSLRLNESLSKAEIKSKSDLSEEFGLDVNKKWILYCDSAGELYSDFIEKGLTPKEMIDASDLASSMGYSYAVGYQKTKEIFTQLDDAFYDNYEIIFRPHPGTKEFKDKHHNMKYKLIRDYSIYTWFRHIEFNVVATSTSIFESDALGIKSFVLNPVAFEHDVVGVVDYSIVRTKETFEDIIRNPEKVKLKSNIFEKYIGALSPDAFNQFSNHVSKILESPKPEFIAECKKNNRKLFTSIIANLAFYLFLKTKLLDSIQVPFAFAMNKYEHPYFKEKYI